MAEPTCVMHPFSYTTPPFSNDTVEVENPMYVMGESVSFGRYVSEELEWEKWSSFDSNNNRNRYVKEAEKYSKPGSVAQKKAYFEAHFKRMAALKAAALLEQANASENTAQESNNVDQFETNNASNPSSNLPVEASGYERAEIVPKEGEISSAGEFVVHQNELYSIGVDDENGNDGKVVNSPSKELKISDKIEIYSASKKDENCKASNEESSGIPQMGKLRLQEKAHVNEEASVTRVKRNPPLSSYIPSPARSANIIHPGKENYATPVKSKSSVSEPDKKRTPLRMSINREFNRIISPVIKKLGNSSKVSKDCTMDPSRTPAKASLNNVQVPPMTPDLSKRGVSSSPSMGRNKISSPIIPNSFCLKSADRTAKRKQKLEDKFNATTTEKAPQPLKFKEKAEAELNKFRQSFCFKSMSSPDYYGDNGTLNSPKPKNESTNHNGIRQTNRTMSHNKSELPPRRPSVRHTGSKSSKRSTLVPS